MDVPVRIDANEDTNQGMASPCVFVCQLDDEEMCIGCFRMIAEIVDWNQFTEEVKERVLHACDTRKLASSDG